MRTNTVFIGRSSRGQPALDFCILGGGYQLCHTCGELLLTGDRCWAQSSNDGYNYWHIREQICAWNNREQNLLKRT